MAASGRFPLAIVGAGALGLAFASRLSRCGRVAVIARTERKARALRAGVKVGRSLFRAEAFGPAAPPPADCVIVLVKTYDTPAALRAAARMGPRAVLSLQNGLVRGVAQGVTTAAAYREGDAVVPVTVGETKVPPGFARLAALLRRAGLPCRVERRIAEARYFKLLANVCINPVTALYGVRNGEVLRPPYRRLVERLAREAAAVLRAEGLRLDDQAALARVTGVARATAGNRSSMLQDVLAGRRTEIEHLNGALLRLARRHRIAAPSHAAVYRAVRNFRAPGGSLRRGGRSERPSMRPALESRQLDSLLRT